MPACQSKSYEHKMIRAKADEESWQSCQPEHGTTERKLLSAASQGAEILPLLLLLPFLPPPSALLHKRGDSSGAGIPAGAISPSCAALPPSVTAYDLLEEHLWPPSLKTNAELSPTTTVTALGLVAFCSACCRSHLLVLSLSAATRFRLAIARAC